MELFSLTQFTGVVFRASSAPVWARRSEYNHKIVKDSSLDAIRDPGAGPVPLCELAEGCVIGVETHQ